MKPQTIEQLAVNFIAKKGLAAPGSPQWEYLRYAFINGYRAAQRRYRDDIKHLRSKVEDL